MPPFGVFLLKTRLYDTFLRFRFQEGILRSFLGVAGGHGVFWRLILKNGRL